KPVDPARGNGVLFYEAGNRGTKRILSTFQGASRSEDPATLAEIGNGSLLFQGFSLLWMGWQWDVPEGRMRMEMPIATQGGAPIRGLVRGNFIGERGTTASLADRGHRAYPVLDPKSSEIQMTVRSGPFDPPETIARERFRFIDSSTVALDSGFEPGRIYDVVYESENPRVVGTGLAGTRDLVSFFKYERGDANPLPGIRFAIGWGVSQTGRFLRHFVYQGFNADENGRIVFDGLIDQVGGAGRGSFNHRFGQASRDALQHFNILYPVDMFPFTDGLEVDPETGIEDGLLRRAVASGTVPKFFHILTNSEFFNRAGSLTITDPAGARDASIPETSRVYFIAGAPHIVGAFPPAPFSDPAFIGRAPMNPLQYDAVVRALFRALVLWVADGTPPPGSAYPRIADGTLAPPERASWPPIPGFEIPHEPQTPHRLDFGPDWKRGIVAFEPPRVGKAFVVLVPVVDENGNDRAGIRLPEIEVPLATHTGWSYRDPSIGAPDRLASEIGSYLPFPRTREDRERARDPRKSVEERYGSEMAYIGAITDSALRLVQKRYLLVEDLPEIVSRAQTHYHWATRAE
ncbi:MAG TPA: alpha/beta hydrolase domain-containing protein, partial [Vicinamibacteria bacterium]